MNRTGGHRFTWGPHYITVFVVAHYLHTRKRVLCSSTLLFMFCSSGFIFGKSTRAEFLWVVECWHIACPYHPHMTIYTPRVQRDHICNEENRDQPWCRKKSKSIKQPSAGWMNSKQAISPRLPFFSSRAAVIAGTAEARRRKNDTKEVFFSFLVKLLVLERCLYNSWSRRFSMGELRK